MWAFCLHSLVREYGWQFLWRVAVPHPLKTAKAVFGSSALDFQGGVTALFPDGPVGDFGGDRSIVGLGFCLKPMDPPCPSGRANHDCAFLENLLESEARDIPVACQRCAIRELGLLTLRTGAAFYIMTSAKDILLDVYSPSLAGRRFSSGVFALCRYSLQPFAVGLLASGIRGWLFTFEKGDCRDYKTWLRADRGIKEEQTAIHAPNQEAIRKLLGEVARAPRPTTHFEKSGNILYPR